MLDLQGPQKCREMLLECCDIAMLICEWRLLLSGDVEEDPGPDEVVQERLRQILANQRGIAEDIKKIGTDQENMRVNQSRLEVSIMEINNKISKLENVMKTVQTLNESVK